MPTKVLSLLLSLSSLSFNLPLFAGNHSSGGGAKFKAYDLNPWFLDNTTDVSYCIEKDEQHFSRSTKELQSDIEFALNIWKKEFSAAGKLQHNTKAVKVATQNFNFKSDCENVDLNFSFGIEPEELKNRAHDDYIGFAQRTSYDEVQFKAKGFIYLAPVTISASEIKTLKLPSSGLNVWNFGQGSNIRLALLHELGHVFGLRHYSIFWEGDLVSELADAVAKVIVQSLGMVFRSLVGSGVEALESGSYNVSTKGEGKNSSLVIEF